MSENTNTQSVLKVLDYTKTNKKWFDDKDLTAGYHTVYIKGERIKGQRDPEIRLAKVDYDFTGKRVLDVGCSNGGLLHALSDKIEYGVGVDFNAKCINAANALRAINRRDNVHFYTFDLDKENLDMLTNFVLGEPVDICFFFNISLWVKCWKDVFKLCSELTETMLFEAHGNEAQQDEQINFVNSIYSDVSLLSEQSDDDPTYAKRKMYICENRIERQKIEGNTTNDIFLKVHTEESVKEAYEKTFPSEVANKIYFYPNTHESVVAEINSDYIVKFPRPHRGLRGLSSEQGVTDLIRNDVGIAVPEISIHKDSAVLARYRKLSGNTFNKEKYNSLSNQEKDNLAHQLAKFMSDIHSVRDIDVERVELSPSWDFKVGLIREQLASDSDEIIRLLVPDLLKNQEVIKVPESNKVLGHFDLHGSNILFNKDNTEVTGVIDFGNAKVGDLHQDLSVMNLSSPDLAMRIALAYEKINDRKLNRLLIQHYTTLFYLNLLAGLKRDKADKKFNYWLVSLKKWYAYLLNDRASAKLAARSPATPISSGWRKWLASNVMKGASPEGLQKILREQGFSHIDIATELKMAESHPYVEAGKEIFLDLKKRNWLLNTCDSIASLNPGYSTKIDVCETPDFETFISDYYSKHLPVKLTGAVDSWTALKKWTPKYLQDKFGDKKIEVQFGRDQDPLFERNAGKHKKIMTMGNYVDLVVSGGESNNYYMTANNTKNSLEGIESIFNDTGDFGSGYRTLEEENAGSFFWFGPQGTFTPIHHDLTNNMVVQILGRKKVTLIPAWQVPFLYNDKGVFSAADFPDFDAKRYPNMSKITPVDVIIGPGESLFIPIGWWHCVESLDVSISVTFTNFNAPNKYSSEFPR
jgi:SAM-dependent methyltransferase